jgi:hypothetical protein
LCFSFCPSFVGFFWDRVSPCCTGWPGTWDLPASVSQMLDYMREVPCLSRAVFFFFLNLHCLYPAHMISHCYLNCPWGSDQSHSVSDIKWQNQPWYSGPLYSVGMPTHSPILPMASGRQTNPNPHPKGCRLFFCRLKWLTDFLLTTNEPSECSCCRLD